jgi:hypothetical protein
MFSPKSITPTLLRNRRKDDNGMVKATIFTKQITEFEISGQVEGDRRFEATPTSACKERTETALHRPRGVQ